jgi:hypothetical protein
VSLTSPARSNGATSTATSRPRKHNRAFFELVECYRANEVWLNPDTCEQVEEFMNNVHQSLGDYVDDLDERGLPATTVSR